MLAPTRVDMLIKAKHYRPNPEFKDTDHCVELDFQDNEAIKQFRNLLARALNCMDPQQTEDWVALQDKLDEVVKEIDSEN